MANQSSRIVLFGVTIAIIVALISNVAGPKVAKRTVETGRQASHVEKPAGSSVRKVAPGSLSPDVVVSEWMRSLSVPAHPEAAHFSEKSYGGSRSISRSGAGCQGLQR